jgi:hypothetical protein
MGATATVSLGSVCERASNRATRIEDPSQSDMSEASIKESIANLAYALWQRRGCPHGSADEDWREAERQLRESPEQVSR